MPDGVAGKRTLIFGGAGGIGRATATALAARGACVALADIDPQQLDAAAEYLASQGHIVRTYQVDVRLRHDVRKVADAVFDDLGRLDVLINAAGIMLMSPVTELRTDEWELSIDLNLKGVLWGIAAVLPTFLKQRSGHLITLGSIHGLNVFPGGAAHSASKFAVRAFSDGLRAELAGHGIRVTTVMPGAVATGMQDKTTGSQRDEIQAIYADAIPSVTVANAIAFAIDQPDSVSINEVVVRPTVQRW
ncbi:short-chain dehydrogenase/reductase SDR [Mycobacterium lentiflavum]|uniref:SDR family oxidoreductase n=1 Tax=Mycobacterium lentiflavum TaxID=141349 RepID=A0A0E4CLY3_MYCLN|nr:SDR family oxidoreductase [Mycobacterium lentiflavum]MEE3065198.1 SDR family oxidoreductase [Actinomycetota bacterium]ULP43421.1 SDR family oxidoreductase [Mycobacterium lentiflavum]CQD07225.1 short-chain dehydrogenase/reductase SDR [Mycobacterium lentiflavum]